MMHSVVRMERSEVRSLCSVKEIQLAQREVGGERDRQPTVRPLGRN